MKTSEFIDQILNPYTQWHYWPEPYLRISKVFIFTAKTENAGRIWWQWALRKTDFSGMGVNFPTIVTYEKIE